MSVLKRTRQQGFTAVELLVTLFIAALFIASGYQLYAVTTTDSANIRERSIASNIAYKYLRIAQAKGFFVCGTETISNSTVEDEQKKLPRLSSIKIIRSMPKSDPCGNGLMKIQVDVRYFENTTSTYITRSEVIYVNS